MGNMMSRTKAEGACLMFYFALSVLRQRPSSAALLSSEDPRRETRARRPMHHPSQRRINTAPRSPKSRRFFAFFSLPIHRLFFSPALTLHSQWTPSSSTSSPPRPSRRLPARPPSRPRPAAEVGPPAALLPERALRPHAAPGSASWKPITLPITLSRPSITRDHDLTMTTALYRLEGLEYAAHWSYPHLQATSTSPHLSLSFVFVLEGDLWSNGLLVALIVPLCAR
ncbi:hypothetical protein FA95DRAFT_633047 [Auriscalpium vulgare]|uniref:Uncharacterized protein n=1 Tax=Auriscalpium vulgare TaxID=40419 RepID=A0ACB8RCT8_9AGAM|nr:hypothetical protein FA95DRAFT_633047 [Auriscalpium vulgare]